MPQCHQADDLHRDLSAVWSRFSAEAASPPSSPTNNPNGEPLFPHTLDEYQTEAASHFMGPIRVLAPAGSGKTRTLTARIAGLISRGVAPEDILALAFNAKAAEEMQDRLASIGADRVTTQTFHALGYEILRDAHGWEYKAENETRANDLAANLITRHLRLPDHSGQAKRFIESGVKLLQTAKSALMPFSEMHLFDGESHQPTAVIFQDWISAQIQHGIVTFSDMIYFALRILIENDEIRASRQARHVYLLVDEFQDLNRAQMLLLSILALPQNNLFAVGDDDQLIYAWRGAEIQHILDFEAYYPTSSSVILATNYRSGQRIVRHGRWLIENNPDRVAKDIRPAVSAEPGKLEIALFPSPMEQASFAIDWVRNQKFLDERDWGDFGLLYRANSDGKWLANELIRRQIPFVMAGDPEPDTGDPPPEVMNGSVTLMTIHKAKGKEFPCVIYFNLSRRGGTLTEADERRVVYVGVTRAKDKLLITADQNKYSPFLREVALNPSFSDYAEPFLMRKLIQSYRQSLLQENKLWSWIHSWLRPLTYDTIPENAIENPSIEPYVTELRFRSALGITIRP